MGPRYSSISGVTDEPLRFDAPPWVHFGIAVAILITLWLGGYIYLGPLLPGLAGGIGVVSLFLWGATTYHRPARRTIFPWYIVGMLAWLVHVGDAWGGGYASVITDLFPGMFAEPVVFNSEIFVIVFGLAATAVFLYGAFGLFLLHPLGNFMAWFLFCWLVGEGVSLFVLPLAGGIGIAYVPGMWSAPLTLAAGGCGIFRLVRDHRF